MSRDWHTRALAALAGFEKEFTAAGLAHRIREHEHPEHDALYVADKAARPQTFTWLRAIDLWEARNPGCSVSSMRRLCDRLVQDGTLTTRLEVRGWHTVRYYRAAVSSKVHDL